MDTKANGPLLAMVADAYEWTVVVWVLSSRWVSDVCGDALLT